MFIQNVNSTFVHFGGHCPLCVAFAVWMQWWGKVSQRSGPGDAIWIVSNSSNVLSRCLRKFKLTQKQQWVNNCKTPYFKTHHLKTLQLTLVTRKTEGISGSLCSTEIQHHVFLAIKRKWFEVQTEDNKVIVGSSLERIMMVVYLPDIKIVIIIWGLHIYFMIYFHLFCKYEIFHN